MVAEFKDKIAKLFFSEEIKREISHQAGINTLSEIEKIKSQLGYGYYAGQAHTDARAAGAKWPYGLITGCGPVLNHFLLRLNARKVYHENMQARSFVERMADCVADVGLKLESVPLFKTLGMSEQRAEDWASDVEERFSLWAMSQHQEVMGSMNFFQAQRFYQIQTHRDGEVFVRLYYRKEENLVNPLQFGFIDPSQVRGDEITTGFGSHLLGDDGIARDEFGKELEYKIWTKDSKTKTFKDVTVPRVGKKSGRLFMLHGYVPEYAGQGRGITRLGSAIQEFSNLTSFTSAQILKAINQSSIMMYTKPSKDAPASNPWEGMMTNKGSGPAQQKDFESVEGAESATNTTATGRSIKYQELPEATISTPGSVGVFGLGSGEDLNAFKETAPSPNFGDFMLAFCSYLSASMSMPIEVVLMKFGENYSASRGALLLFWRVAVRWRGEMSSDFLNPIYHMWLAEEIAAGRIFAPGWQNPLLRLAWLNNNWIGAPMPNIDPKRTAEADRTYVEMGAQNLGRVAQNLNGSDGKANRRRLKRELSEMPERELMERIKK